VRRPREMAQAYLSGASRPKIPPPVPAKVYPLGGWHPVYFFYFLLFPFRIRASPSVPSSPDEDIATPASPLLTCQRLRRTSQTERTSSLGVRLQVWLKKAGHNPAGEANSLRPLSPLWQTTNFVLICVYPCLPRFKNKPIYQLPITRL
jgi:hypothetical protein